MPPTSEAQRGWAFANRKKRGKEGAAAREYAASDPGGKLPARASAREPAYKPKKRPLNWNTK